MVVYTVYHDCMYEYSVCVHSGKLGNIVIKGGQSPNAADSSAYNIQYTDPHLMIRTAFVNVFGAE